MVERLFSLVFATAIAGAPVAPEACQIVCASTSAHEMSAHDTHHGDHHATASEGPRQGTPPASTFQRSGESRPCDHGREANVASIATPRNSDTVMLPAAPVTPADEVVLPGGTTLIQGRHSARPHRLDTRLGPPLRI